MQETSNYTYIPNHLVLGILTTIFCCLPFGIVSIVYAAQVNSALMQGNIAQAQMLSEKAKFWGILALAIGIALNVISLIFFFVAGMAQQM